MLYRGTLLRNFLLYDDCLDAVGLLFTLYNIKKITRNPKKRHLFQGVLSVSVGVPYPSMEQTFSGIKARHACFSKS